MKTTIPPPISDPRVGDLIDAAIAARLREDYSDATHQAYRALALASGEHRYYRMVVLRELGYAFKQRKDFVSAAVCYRNAVALWPKGELVSWGLFSSLLRLRCLDEAFQEAIRFLSLRKSEIYDATLLNPDYGRGLPPSARALCEQAKQLAARWS